LLLFSSHTAQPKHGTRLREHERQGDAAADLRGTQTGHGRRHNVLQEILGKASVTAPGKRLEHKYLSVQANQHRDV